MTKSILHGKHKNLFCQTSKTVDSYTWLFAVHIIQIMCTKRHSWSSVGNMLLVLIDTLEMILLINTWSKSRSTATVIKSPLIFASRQWVPIDKYSSLFMNENNTESRSLVYTKPPCGDHYLWNHLLFSLYPLW